MTPRQFFDEVAKPNAQQAIANRGDLRCAVNAIVTLDAVLGFMHVELRRRSTKGLPCTMRRVRHRHADHSDSWRVRLLPLFATNLALKRGNHGRKI